MQVAKGKNQRKGEQQRRSVSKQKDKQMLLELGEVWLAAGRGLGSPLLMYFSCIC